MDVSNRPLYTFMNSIAPKPTSSVIDRTDLGANVCCDGRYWQYYFIVLKRKF
jgi:hypothetical protein